MLQIIVASVTAAETAVLTYISWRNLSELRRERLRPTTRKVIALFIDEVLRWTKVLLADAKHVKNRKFDSLLDIPLLPRNKACE